MDSMKVDKVQKHSKVELGSRKKKPRFIITVWMEHLATLLQHLQLAAFLICVFVTPEAATASTPVNVVQSIIEEADPNTLVTDILEHLNSNGKHLTNNGIEVNFQIFHAQPKMADRYFKVTRDDGKVSIKHRIDRDTLCSEIGACCDTNEIDSPQCQLKLQIQSDKEYSYIISLTVIVRDKNDNTPKWPSDEITREFSENSMIGEYRSLPLAKDADAGINSVQKYEIMEPKPMEFDVRYDTSSSGSSKELKLYLKTALNREVKELYSFTLMATDGGYPSKNGTVKIRVIVTDENDEQPIFDKSQYLVTIPEDLKPNMEVIRVHATDKDAGLNGEVVYFISPFTDSKYRSLFSIDPNTGIIRVARQLDYESETDIQLTIVAEDRNPHSKKQGTTLVIVKLNDVNDEEPKIIMKGSSAYVYENERSHKTVEILTITDKDSGINGEVTCHLTDHEDMFGLEPLNMKGSTLYKLVTARVLDREEDGIYNRPVSLNVQCVDKGIPAKTANKIIPVEIKDINDNAPKFSQSTYHENVNENSKVKSELFTITATDRDYGKNALLSYWLNGTEFFKIHTDGRLYLVKALDREKQDKHVFTVLAKDHGEESLTGSAVVVITVDDHNDHTPRIDKFFQFNVPENFSTGHVIGKLNATDEDIGENARLRFDMMVQSPASSYFHVNWEGEILLTRTLDREKTPSFDFKVTVKDQAKYSARSATTTVMVHVLDINDCQPRFLFPTKGNNTIYIHTNIPVSSEIARVTAIDNDADENGRVFYYIKDQHSSHFHVDLETGIIRLVQPLNQNIIKAPRKLVLIARDGGNPPKEDQAVLTIAFKRSQKILFSDEMQEGNENMMILVGLVSVTGIFVLILVFGIILLSCRRRCLMTFATTRRHDQELGGLKMSDDPNKTVTAQCLGSLHYPKEAPGYLSYQHDSLDHSQHSLDSGKGGSSIDNNNSRLRGCQVLTFTGGDGDHNQQTSYQALTKTMKSQKGIPENEMMQRHKAPNPYESLMKRSHRKEANNSENIEEQPPEYYGLTYTTVQHPKTQNEGVTKYSPMVNASFV